MWGSRRVQSPRPRDPASQLRYSWAGRGGLSDACSLNLPAEEPLAAVAEQAEWPTMLR